MKKIKKIWQAIAAGVLFVPFAAYAKLPIPNPAPGTLPGNSGGYDAPALLFTIINILLAFTGLVAVLFIIIGGFRYITSAGNEELAEAGKKTLQNAIIGLIIIILSYVIVSVINNFFNGIV
jgi:hypothetical protein